MKPDNKLGKLRFDPDGAFENLRAKMRIVLGVSKEEMARRIADERHRKKRRTKA